MKQAEADLQISPLVYTGASIQASSQDCPRLAVILFEIHEEALLARRILELAHARGLSVVLIGVAPDPAGEAELRRNLATVAAFLKEQCYPPVQSEIRVESGKGWIAALKSQMHSGDLLACYSEQMVSVRNQPLCDVLSSQVNLPVYSFSGLGEPRPRHRLALPQVGSWLGSAASIIGFSFLQARIVMAMQGVTEAAILIVTLFAEIGFLWFINSELG